MGLDQYIKGRKNDDAVWVDIVDLRKANAVQKWFADRLWYGDDRNCEETPFDAELMDEFIETGKKILTLVGDKLNKNTGLNLANLWEVEDLEKAIAGDTPVDAQTYNSAWDTIEQAVALCAEEISELMPPTRGFFFGEAVWDGWQLYQTHRCIYALLQFQRDLTEEDSPEYTYECWY